MSVHAGVPQGTLLSMHAETSKASKLASERSNSYQTSAGKHLCFFTVMDLKPHLSNSRLSIPSIYPECPEILKTSNS